METCSHDHEELHAAISNNCLETARYLISNFGMPHQRYNECQMLLFAMSKGNNEITKLILINSSNVNCKKGVNTPLHVATKTNNVEIIKILLEKRAAINAVNEDSNTPLHFAAKSGNKEIIELFLDKGAEINAQNKYGSTSLYVAIVNTCWPNSNKYMEVIKLLLERGACVNKCNIYGNTPLHAAVKNSPSAITKLLLSKKPRVNRKNNSGQTPLHCAVINEDMKVPKLLLNRGAYIDAQDNNGETPLHSAIEKKRTEITKLFLRKGCQVNIKNKIFNTPLHLASINGCTEFVEILLDGSAYINATNGICYTPLHYAVARRDMELAKLLMNRRARINIKAIKNKISTRPLHLAVKKGYPEFVEILLDRGANINAFYGIGYSPLHYAVGCRHTELAKLLINRGAHINAKSIKDKESNTPLHLATINGYTEFVEILLDRCADINAVNKDCNTPLHCAILSYDMELIEMLLNRGACVNAQNNNGKAPLHFAIEQKYTEIIKVLLNRGASVNTQDHNGNTPLHVVMDNEHSKIIKLSKNSEVTIKKKNCTKIICTWVCDHIEIVKMLVYRQADINAVNKNGNTPLNDAIATKRVEVTKFLINHGAHVNAEINNGKAPLDILIYTYYTKIEAIDIYEIIELLLNKRTLECNARYNLTPDSIECDTIAKLLLDRGATVDTQDKNGGTTLDLAIEKSKAKIVERIMNAYPDVFDNNCKRCLNIAMNNFRNHYREILYGCVEFNSHWKDIYYCTLLLQNPKFKEVFLEYSVNINSQVVPLHFAALTGSEDICTMLLNEGASINQKENGITALHIAIMNGHRNLVDVLMKNGAEFGSEVKGGMTRPIHIAAERGDAVIVETLLKFGADADCTDKTNRTALRIASDKCFFEVVLILLAYGAGPYNVIPSKNHDIVRIVEKAVLMRLAANLQLNERNVGVRSLNVTDLSNCTEEVEKLRRERIYGRASFYDIVIKDPSRLAMYARNENVKRIVNSGVYREKFPEYANMIDNNFKKGEIREMLNSRVKSLDLLSGYRLPHLVTVQIFSYLSNSDLENLIDACPNNVAFRKSLAADRLAIYERNDGGKHSEHVAMDDDITMD